MKLRIVFVLVLVLVAAAGFFLWYRSQNVVSQGGSTSPVLVDIITPSNGASVNQGDALSILAQAWSPNPISAIQLWMDGEMLASENPQNVAVPVKVSWDWEAANPGIHSLFVRASDSEGEEGQSQTLILNVAPGGYQQVLAGAGDTLEGLAGAAGSSLEQVVSLNPGFDPAQPLEDGQPIIFPPNPSSGENQPGGEGTGGADLVIRWQFTPTTEVDNSYCYQSVGGENWQRVPDLPFSFLPGGEWLQTEYSLPAGQQLTLFLECWGWQGSALKYLGEGQTSLDYQQIPDEIVITGPGFEAEGLPEMKPLGGGGIPDGDFQVPAPFALREAESVAACTYHGGNSFWENLWADLTGSPQKPQTVDCDGLMNSQTKEYYVLVWEWEPKQCWPNTPCAQGNEIGGYELFEIDLSSSSVTFIRDILNPEQKVSAVPLPWAGICFGVRAFVENPAVGKVNSEMTTWCGEPPETEKVVLYPSEWLSSEGMWINEGCDNWADAFRLKPNGSQVVVGFFYFGVEKYCDIKQGSATAAVQFSNLILPPEAALQRATLKFASAEVALEGPGSPSSYLHPGSCATRVGKAKSDWTTLVASYSGSYLIHPDSLGPYYTPYASIGSLWSGQNGVDVTSAVLGWMDNPSTNHGFILIADLGDLYDSYVFEPGWDVKICYSVLDNVELEIEYVMPN